MRHLWIVLGALAARRLMCAQAHNIGKSCIKNTFLTDSISKDLNHEWTRIHTNTGALGPFRIRAD
jgi:hypothetical protein